MSRLYRSREELVQSINRNLAQLNDQRANLAILKTGAEVPGEPYLTLNGCQSNVEGLESCIESQRKLLDLQFGG